jgi:hypothetical protein
VNNPSFIYYMVCISLILLGILLTVIEFRGMSLSKNAIPHELSALRISSRTAAAGHVVRTRREPNSTSLSIQRA